MNKSEMVDAIASKATITKKEALAALDAFRDVLMESMWKGEKVKIQGIGNFEKVRDKERVGRNPHTGESITISAHGRVKFTPSKELKDAVR